MVATAEHDRTSRSGARSTYDVMGNNTTIGDYNSANEMTSGGITYDANGNMTVDQNGYHYSYDAWNQLVAVTDAAGNWVVGYVYDGLGRRVEEVTETLTEGGAVPEITDVFYSTSWQILQEGGGADGTDDGRTVKVWSPVFVNALAEERTTTLNTTTTQVMTTDTSFSITAIFDTSGVNLGRVSYNSWDGAFGQATYYLSDSADGGAFGTTTSAGLTTTGWQGGEFMAPIDSYVFDKRVYNVTQRRWSTGEPSGAGYIDGMNLYEGMADNPVNYTDPTGLYDLGSNRLFTGLFGNYIQKLIWGVYDAAHPVDYFEGRIWNNRAISTIFKDIEYPKKINDTSRPDIVHLFGNASSSPASCGTFNIYEIKPAAGAFASYNIGGDAGGGGYYGTGEGHGPVNSGVSLAQSEARWYGSKFGDQGFKWQLGSKDALGTSGQVWYGKLRISWNSPANGAIVYSVDAADEDREKVIAYLRHTAFVNNIELQANGSFGDDPNSWEGNAQSEVTPFLLAGAWWAFGPGATGVAGAEEAGVAGASEPTIPLWEFKGGPGPVPLPLPQEIFGP